MKLIAGPRRSDGLESSRADLQFYSERAHYRNGLLKLHCLSSIVQPYNVNSEEVVIGENAKYTNSPQLGRMLGGVLIFNFELQFFSFLFSHRIDEQGRAYHHRHQEHRLPRRRHSQSDVHLTGQDGAQAEFHRQ